MKKKLFVLLLILIAIKFNAQTIDPKCLPYDFPQQGMKDKVLEEKCLTTYNQFRQSGSYELSKKH